VRITATLGYLRAQIDLRARGEVDVGLVDDHQRLGGRLDQRFEPIARDEVAGGVVGRGHEDHVGPREIDGLAHAAQVEIPRGVERHLDDLEAPGAGAQAVHHEGRRGGDDGRRRAPDRAADRAR
jgi:hypothetical protein